MRARARQNGVYAAPAGGPMRLVCPECEARPGWRCTRMSALGEVKPMSRVHDARMRAARDAGWQSRGRKPPEGSPRGATPGGTAGGTSNEVHPGEVSRGTGSPGGVDNPRGVRAGGLGGVIGER